MTRILIAVALAGVAVGSVGCADRGPGAAQRTPPRPTTTTTAPFPESEPWVATPNEVELELKQAAADTLRALFSYEEGAGTVEAARARLEGLPAEPVVADKAAALLNPAAEGAADVLYPQMGGLTPSRASAMVVTRLRWREGNVDRAELRTMDVRLARRSGVWQVTDLVSLGGSPPATPAALSAAAQRVMGHPQIELPDSARWDIASGLISDRVLEALATLADSHTVRVAVLSTGHPHEVFGTSRTSNHTRGRAVDIWSVDGPVVEQRDPNGPLPAVIRLMLDAGVRELGAPLAVAGNQGASFADALHQDHLHLGFDAG